MKKTYGVGIKGVNVTRPYRVVATGKREARWVYVNLYAPPGTKYSQTVCWEWGKAEQC